MTDEQMRLHEKVIAKIQEDPDFLGHLIEDPDGTLESSGLVTDPSDFASRLDDATEDEEVAGHHHHRSYFLTCRFWYTGYWWHGDRV